MVWPGHLPTSAVAPAGCLLVAKILYQEDFTTPGISPRSARPRKQRRHTPNLRKNARGRPHSLQRLCLREENFGFLASLTRFAVVDIVFENPLSSGLKPRSGTAFRTAA